MVASAPIRKRIEQPYLTRRLSPTITISGVVRRRSYANRWSSTDGSAFVTLPMFRRIKICTGFRRIVGRHESAIIPTSGPKQS
jgi:hypothetical protein